MIEAAVIAILDAGTYTYVDPDKVYVNRVPQDVTAPYAFLTRISTIPQNSKGSGSHIDSARIQITIVSSLLQTCENWETEIRAELDNYLETSIGGSLIGQIQFSNKVSLYDDEVNLHLMAVDYFITEKF